MLIYYNFPEQTIMVAAVITAILLKFSRNHGYRGKVCEGVTR